MLHLPNGAKTSLGWHIIGSFQVRQVRTQGNIVVENANSDTDVSISSEIGIEEENVRESSNNINPDRPQTPVDSGSNDADNDESSSQGDEALSEEPESDEHSGEEADSSDSDEKDNLNYIR